MPKQSSTQFVKMFFTDRHRGGNLANILGVEGEINKWIASQEAGPKKFKVEQMMIGSVDEENWARTIYLLCSLSGNAGQKAKHSLTLRQEMLDRLVVPTSS